MQLAWKTTLALAVAAAMTAPIAQAEWYAFGTHEPDTQYDAEYGFTDPPGVGESKIYFNAFSTYEGITSLGVLNPNVGSLNTQIEVTNDEYHFALLGVWKDCNGDGYVGIAESALREYPATLLATTDACPAVTAPALGPWPSGAHNYNGWVSEFVSIVKVGMGNIDRRTYRDDDARVWGDYHRPDEQPFHRSCTLRPFARGTTEDTGGMLNYVDCRQPVLENFNTAVDTIGDPLGLRFEDEDDAHSGPLGHFPIGGEESSDHAAVYTADCSSDPIRVGDVLNSTPLGPLPTTGTTGVHNQEVWEVDVTFDSTPQDTTIAGQMNATLEERRQNCDYSDDFGHDFSGNFETDFNGVNPKNKTEADWNFAHTFSTTSRGTQPYQTAGAPLGWNGPAGAPSDHGKGYGTLWGSDSTWLSKTGPRTVRLDLENGGVSIAPAYWLTFYAKVGQATLDRGFSMKSSSSGTYGSWHCGANTEGIHNGWNCDADVWYINPDGTFPSAATLAQVAKPGMTYQFRDVDCYDGRIGDTGLGIEPAFYGPEPCIPVS